MQMRTDFDLNMVAFFDVHESGNNPLLCGKMDITYGFMRMMAFFYTLDYINTNPFAKFDSTMIVGGIAIDICKHEDRLRQDLFTYVNGQGLCNYANYTEMIYPWTAMAYMTMETRYSQIAGDFFNSLGITHISPMSTSIKLNDRKAYPHFLRTVPPDTLQAEAIASVLKMFDWSYFLGINSDNEYGNNGMNALTKIAHAENSSLCIAKKLALSPNADINEAMAVLKELDKHTYAKVLVLFTTPAQTKLVLQAARALSLYGRFIFFGSDAWADDENVISGVEQIALGALTVEIKSYVVHQFLKWVTQISPQNRRNIPTDWFDEFWQHIHKCRIVGSIVRQSQYVKLCTMKEVITLDMLKYDPTTLHIIISTYIVARGVSLIPECRHYPIDYCLWRMTEKMKHEVIYENVYAAQWKVLEEFLEDDSFLFKFTEEGYGDLGYVINNYKIEPLTGNYIYQKIGTWMEKLEMRIVDYVHYGPEGDPIYDIPVSICPANIKCDCRGNSGKSNYISELKSPLSKEASFSRIWAMILAVLCVLAFIVSLVLFIYLLFSYPNRGGSTVLGYMLLVGIILLYAHNFAFILIPCDTVCGFRRFCQGLVYAIIFSAMLVKVMNTWRVDSYDDYATASYKRFSHPFGLFCIATGLTLVQVIIGIEWLTLVPPKVELIPYEGQWWPRCVPHGFHNEGLVLSMMYVMLLVVLTIIFSALTWRSEENSRESRWVLATCIFTVALWVIWMFVSIWAPLQYRDAVIAWCNFINATLILVILYVRKLYLLNKYQKDAEKEKSDYVYENKAYQNELKDKESEAGIEKTVL